MLPCGRSEGQESGWRWPRGPGEGAPGQAGFLLRITGCLRARLLITESSQGPGPDTGLREAQTLPVW